MEQIRYCAVVANEIIELSDLYMCCTKYSKRRTKKQVGYCMHKAGFDRL